MRTLAYHINSSILYPIGILLLLASANRLGVSVMEQIGWKRSAKERRSVLQNEISRTHGVYIAVSRNRCIISGGIGYEQRGIISHIQQGIKGDSLARPKWKVTKLESYPAPYP